MMAAVVAVVMAVVAVSDDNENYECKYFGCFALVMYVYDVERYMLLVLMVQYLVVQKKK